MSTLFSRLGSRMACCAHCANSKPTGSLSLTNKFTNTHIKHCSRQDGGIQFQFVARNSHILFSEAKKVSLMNCRIPHKRSEVSRVEGGVAFCDRLVWAGTCTLSYMAPSHHPSLVPPAQHLTQYTSLSFAFLPAYLPILRLLLPLTHFTLLTSHLFILSSCLFAMGVTL